ncbi:MAG: YlbF family regulator [Lachnospiraceae bacterium]
MSELDCAVDNLIAAIKDTKEYRTYVMEKEKVSRFPELKAQIDDYRIRNYEIQCMSNDDDLFHKMEDFEREYEKFRENPLVSDFLAAELDFCRMMQNMNIKVTAALDFN